MKFIPEISDLYTDASHVTKQLLCIYYRVNYMRDNDFFTVHSQGYNERGTKFTTGEFTRTNERPRSVQVSRRSLQTRRYYFLCACIPARTRSRSIGALLHASKHHQVNLLPLLVLFKYVLSSNLIGGVHHEFLSYEHSNELTRLTSCSYCINLRPIDSK